jgi:homoserine kinase
MGALTVARMANQVQAQVVEVKPKGKWPLLLVVPDAPLSTEQARRVLPFQYSRADAVGNIQNSMLLLAAFTQERRDLLPSVLEDRIHQPYRAPLCPLLPALKELTGDSGILGACLSGAGPSVLVFLDPKVSPKTAKQRIAAHLAKRRLTAELLLTQIAHHGGCDGADWRKKHGPTKK